MKAEQADTIKEYHEVDRERETLQSMQRKSDYGSQVMRGGKGV
jgi:hypothetical protein